MCATKAGKQNLGFVRGILHSMSHVSTDFNNRPFASSLSHVERENNITLENYTRRENLKFMNLPEERGENCKEKIIGLIQNDLEIDARNIRFHAVHRIGKVTADRSRPIIASFVCREDRELVWSKIKKLKNSTTHRDARLRQSNPTRTSHFDQSNEKSQRSRP